MNYETLENYMTNEEYATTLVKRALDILKKDNQRKAQSLTLEELCVIKSILLCVIDMYKNGEIEFVRGKYAQVKLLVDKIDNILQEKKL